MRTFTKKPSKNDIKLIVHTYKGKKGLYEIRVQNTTDGNGKTSRNILKKMSRSHSSELERNRGFYIEDLLVIKKNWNKIIKAMTS